MLEYLLDFLTSGHEEALVAAVATFKSLICSCVDENLIKKGVDQITASANSTTRKPTVIEKVCATIESLLDYQYEAVWDMSFQIVSTMFEKLGRCTRFILLLSYLILIDSLDNWRRLLFLMILQIMGCSLFGVCSFFLLLSWGLTNFLHP